MEPDSGSHDSSGGVDIISVGRGWQLRVTQAAAAAAAAAPITMAVAHDCDRSNNLIE